MIKPSAVETDNTEYLTAEELFTDREEPRKAFWDMYNSMEKGCSDVITYYGTGGIGKTRLLEQLCYEIKEKTPKKKMPNFAFCSFEGNVSKEKFLYNLSRQMMLYNKKLRFPLFDAAFTKIATADGKDLKAFEENARKFFVDNDLVDIAINIGGQFLPGLEPATKIVKAICSFASGRKYKNELEKGPNSQLYFAVMSKKEGKEIRSNYIHECFKRDVKAFFAEMEQPYVVFIDGYENYVSLLKNENYADDKDDWLREALVKELPNVLWVIAGREKLNWDEELLPSDQQHRVGDLSQKDTAEFFKKVNIVDEELVGQLYKLTNGTPAYLYLCKRTYEKIVEIRKPVIDDFGKNTSELVERYLENMSDSDKKIMIMLSFFPKVWDIHMAENVARALGYEGYIDNIYKLVKMSLFERVENGYKLHETFRSVVKNAHKDRQERIGTAIIQYLTQILLKSRASMDYMHRCMQFVEVFELCEKKVVYDEDMKIILPDILVAVSVTSSYIEGEYLFSAIEKRLEKCEYSFEVLLECKNARYVNLLALGNYSDCLELAKQTAVNIEQKSNVQLLCLIEFYEVFGNAYLRVGEYQEALEYMTKAYSLALDELGENNEMVVLIMSSIARVYRGLGRYLIVKDILEQVYEKMKGFYGEDDFLMIEVSNELASAYYDIGEYEKTKELVEKAYERKLSIWGEGHMLTMPELFNVARIHGAFGEYESAKEKLLIVYNTYVKTMGEKHPNTVEVLNSIASIYSRLKQHDKAVEIYERVYYIRKSILGNKHPDTVIVLNNIAIEYKGLGEYNQAKALYVQALEMLMDKVGEKHLYVSKVLTGLGDIYEAFGEYEEAKCYYEKAYEIKKDMLGEDALDTVITLNQLAISLFNTKEYEKAKLLFKKVCEVYINKNVENHILTVAALFYMAKISSDFGEYEEAKNMYEQLYRYMKDYVGEKSLETFNVSNDLAYVYNCLGEYENVIKLYEQSYDEMKELIGVEHSYILSALYNIATAYCGLEDYKKAKELYEELYVIISTMPEQKEFVASVGEIVEELNEKIEK